MKERLNPLSLLKGEIASAKEGRDLRYSQEEWLQMLQLDGETADGKTVLERLAPNRGFFGKMRVLFRDAGPVERDLTAMLVRLSDGDITPQEEQLSQTMATVFSRQIQREQGICPQADFYAATMFILRPDYFPKELHGQLAFSALKIINQYDRNNR